MCGHRNGSVERSEGPKCDRRSRGRSRYGEMGKMGAVEGARTMEMADRVGLLSPARTGARGTEEMGAPQIGGEE